MAMVWTAKAKHFLLCFFFVLGSVRLKFQTVHTNQSNGYEVTIVGVGLQQSQHDMICMTACILIFDFDSKHVKQSDKHIQFISCILGINAIYVALRTLTCIA